ncbi:MAG: mycothiol synthase [Gaiellaceae bacterium]|jgi:mycothiol synthase|nr:mycothiol synthase [Gaiellaceae bacterium]
MSSSLPEGFHVRPVTAEDAAAVNELVVAVDTAVQGWSDSTVAELVDWWRETDLTTNSWVVEDDSVAAYAVVIPHGTTADIDGFVHPAKRGLGLGSWLLGRGEERVRELGFSSVLTWCLAPDASARALFDSAGYREVRRFYRMLVEHEDVPPAAEWPEGFRVGTVEAGEERAFHSAIAEAFAEEWNFVAQPYEQWAARRVDVPDFDPTLWFIVRDREDEIAAVLRGEADRGGAGFVGAIGVLPPWRKQGLGLALLRHAFLDFHRRGQSRVALGVDAQNPTGATRLYERAGMHVAYEAVAFEKVLA